jgi:RNA-directed DNA polymerase
VVNRPISRLLGVVSKDPHPFDFLGYTFGRRCCGREHYFRIGASPSKKAQKRLKEKVNTLLRRGNPTPWAELRDKLNRLLVGWANYFSFGGVREAYGAIWWHVVERVHLFLCKRHKLRTRGAGGFGFREIYGSIGVADLRRRIPRYSGRPAHVLS